MGDEINVKVLNFDEEKERVSLGMKQLTADPWSTAYEKYPVGGKVSGTIVSLTDYGALSSWRKGLKA